MPSLVFIQLILHAKLGKAWVLEIFLEKKKDSCDIMEWRHIFSHFSKGKEQSIKVWSLSKKGFGFTVFQKIFTILL